MPGCEASTNVPALAVDPASVHGHYGLAQVALLDGDTEEAIRRLQIALRLAPHHGEMLCKTPCLAVLLWAFQA